MAQEKPQAVVFADAVDRILGSALPPGKGNGVLTILSSFCSPD